MRLKTFRAFTLNEALEAAKADLGEAAAILHTRTFRRGGFFGLGGREIVEIIASESAEEEIGAGSGIESTDSTDERSEIAGTATTAATRAYARSMLPESPSGGSVPSDDSAGGVTTVEATPASGSLVVDREKTKTLARALAIRLERQQAARSSAGVSGPDDVIEATRSTTDPASDIDPEAVVPRAHAAAGATSADESTVSPAVASPTGDDAESFVIGPGGILLPDDDAPPPAPRVIALTPSSDPVRSIEIEAPATNTGSKSESVSIEAGVDPATGSVAGTELDATDEPVMQAVPPIPPAASPTGDAGPGADELDAIRTTVGRLLAVGGVPAPDSGDPASVSAGRSDALADAYASLIAQELSRDLAERVVASLQEELDEASIDDPEAVRAALLGHLAALVPTAEDLEFARPRDGRPRTIAFVGPTGVGKTTTLAKIAATMTLRDEIKVGLVTSDTYRIAAVDQLRTYAEILGLRLEIAATPVEMRAALDRCADLDAVLIDTPGRSQNDADRIADLRALVDAARPHETHLVLSGTAAERVLIREAEAFSTLGPDRVVLTKLDEAVTFGMLVSVVRRIGRRISWVTTGQEVPTDVERATSHRLANLMLGESVKS